MERKEIKRKFSEKIKGEPFHSIDKRIIFWPRHKRRKTFTSPPSSRGRPEVKYRRTRKIEHIWQAGRIAYRFWKTSREQEMEGPLYTAFLERAMTRLIEEALGIPCIHWRKFSIEREKRRITVTGPGGIEYTVSISIISEMPGAESVASAEPIVETPKTPDKPSPKKESQETEKANIKIDMGKALHVLTKLSYIKETTGISWPELAQILSVDPETLDLWLKQEAFPSRETVKKIEGLYRTLLTMEDVLTKEGIRRFLQTYNPSFGKKPIELLQEGNWETLEKEFVAITEGLPL